MKVALAALAAFVALAAPRAAEAGWCGGGGGGGSASAPSAPTSGGGSGRSTATSDGVALDPLLAVKWFPELLRVRTATGEAATAPTADEKEKKVPAEEKKAEDLGAVRGLELPRDLVKPVLVYFHWPHEDGSRGKQVVKFCNGPLDDEAFVRVTPLFHCVEVNTRDSEVKLVEEAKVRVTPSLAVCRPDGTVVFRSEDTGLNGKVLAEILKKVMKEKFPAAWEGVEKEIADQRKNLVEGKRLLAAGKVEEGMALVNLVVGSEVHFTDAWADGVKTLREEEKKAADAEKAKKAR